MPPLNPQELVGQKLGRFEVLSVLGAGGMGVVLLAQDPALGRRVALKVLADETNETARRLFLREARAAAAVTHPNLATIYEVGEDQGRAYLAMELIEGSSLRSLIDQQLPVPRARELALQIARGLARAHQAGIVHRDLKPDNVMVGADGTAKILDFGLAKQRAAPAPDEEGMAATVPRALTVEGTIMGTPGYLAPEQAQGLPADARADVFSFGVLLYELLTGRRAFPARTTMEGIVAVCRDEPPSVSALNPTIPFALQALVVACLSKDPERRPRDGTALVAALESVDGSASSSPGLLPTVASLPVASTPPAPAAQRPRARWKVPVTALGILLALGVTAGAVRRVAGPTTSSLEPRYGGTLRVGSVREASRQRLFVGSVQLGELAQDAVSEPLVSPLARTPVVQLQQRDEGRTVALTLAPGVSFHPHPCTPGGRAATLEDLAYSVELGLTNLGGLKASVSTEGSEVLLRLEQPAPFVADWLGGVPLAPRGLADCASLTDLSLLPGAGPLQAEPGTDGRLAFTRFPTGRWRDAQGRELPFLERLELSSEPDPLRLMGRVAAGELDVAVLDLEGSQPFVEATSDGAFRLTQAWARPGLSVAANVVPSLSTMYFLQVLPREDGPLRDDALRQALTRAIDRGALASALAPRRLLPTGRLLHSRQRGFDASVEEARFEPERLRALLASRPGGVPELVIGHSSAARNVAPALVELLTRAGLRVRTEELLATSLDGMRRAGYDAALFSTSVTEVEEEPWNLARVAYQAQQRFEDAPEATAAWEKLLVERDRAARARLYAPLERALLDRAVMIPLLRLPLDSPRVAHAFFVYRDHVRGLADPLTGRLRAEGTQPAAPLLGVWLAPR